MPDHTIGETARRTGAATALVSAALLVLVGCGPNTNAASSTDSSTSPAPTSASAACQHVGSVNFDKTKFVFHMGLAFGAFHHFIYNPFRSGQLSSGARGRVKNLVEAGLATAFTVHELRLAKQDAESSPTLCKIVAPLDNAEAALSVTQDRVKSGDVTASDLDGVNNSVGSAGQLSAQAGIPIHDQVPSSAQLANPS